MLCGHLGTERVLRQLKRWPEARVALERMLKDARLRAGDPKWIWAYQHLGELEVERGGDKAQAARWYAKAERAVSDVQWPSADDRREVLDGIYKKWLEVLKPGDPQRAVIVAKQGALLPAVATAEPAPR
jgi:hypothetical protein